MDNENHSGSGMSLSEIEAGLERLMPRGLNDDTCHDLEAVVDDLAAEACPTSFALFGDAEAPRTNSSRIWQVAAALTVGALGLAWLSQSQDQTAPGLVSVGTAAAAEVSFPIEILAETAWIETGSELGSNGLSQSEEVSQGWRYSGIKEERLRHESSGYEVILQCEFDAELYADSSL